MYLTDALTCSCIRTGRSRNPSGQLPKLRTLLRFPSPAPRSPRLSRVTLQINLKRRTLLSRSGVSSENFFGAVFVDVSG